MNHTSACININFGEKFLRNNFNCLFRLVRGANKHRSYHTSAEDSPMNHVEIYIRCEDSGRVERSGKGQHYKYDEKGGP